MGFRVETVLASPDTGQYAGERRPAPGFAEVAEAAKAMEALGFDGVTTPEAGHDPFLPLAIAAEHTRRVRVGTNIAVAFPRSPMVMAQLAWDLQRLSGGRFALGLGTQVRTHVERRYASTWVSPPGPRLREYLLCLRAIFESFRTGRVVAFDGEHYRFDLLPPFFDPGPIDRPAIPLHVAAVNRYTSRMAGELADGIRLHPIATFRYTRDVVRTAVAEGATRAGRDVARFELIGAPFLATGRDAAAVEAARRDARQHIAFYASTRTYRAVLEYHGWEALGDELNQLARDQRYREMPALITDEMLDEWAISATWDDLARELRRRLKGLFPTLLLDLPPDLRAEPDRVRDLVDNLHLDRAT